MNKKQLGELNYWEFGIVECLICGTRKYASNTICISNISLFKHLNISSKCCKDPEYHWSN